MRKTTLVVGLLVLMLVGTGMASGENDWDADEIITIDAGEYYYWDIGTLSDIYDGTLYYDVDSLEDDPDIMVKIVDEGGSVLQERSGDHIIGELYVTAGIPIQLQVHSNYWIEDQTVSVKYRIELDIPDTSNGDDDNGDDNSTPGFGVGIIVATMILTSVALLRDRRKEEEYIPKIQEIVGTEYNVKESSSTGDVQVRSNSVVVFRIYQSVVRDGNPYIVKLDVGEHRETASKIAEELGLELVG